MKNMKILGIIAMAAIIGFTLTACPEDDNSGSGLGEELKLSGQVYTEVYNENETTGAVSYTYTPFTGNLTIDDGGLGDNGVVTAGQLSYTIGTPNSEALVAIEDSWSVNLFAGEEMPVILSDPTVKGVGLGFSTSNGGVLYRGKFSASGTETNGTFTWEYAGYFYVDKDVTISKARETGTSTEQYGGITNNYIWTSNGYSLGLKKGWNAIYSKYTEVSSFNAATNTNTYTRTYSVSTSIPSGLYWIYDEGY